jgi:hypothetical protein
VRPLLLPSRTSSVTICPTGAIPAHTLSYVFSLSGLDPGPTFHLALMPVMISYFAPVATARTISSPSSRLRSLFRDPRCRLHPSLSTLSQTLLPLPSTCFLPAAPSELYSDVSARSTPECRCHEPIALRNHLSSPGIPAERLVSPIHTSLLHLSRSPVIHWSMQLQHCVLQFLPICPIFRPSSTCSAKA